MVLEHPLDGALLKLERAKHHFRDLNSEVRTFMDGKPYAVTVDVNAEPGRHFVRAHVYRPIPAALGVIVGDAVHNLRSVLDHLVWELSLQCWRAQPNTVPQPDKRTEFPIFSQAPTSNNAAFNKKVKSLSPPIVAVVQGLQPYTVSPNEPESHPLWLLQDLNIWDKHKRIALTLLSPSIIRYAMRKHGETIHGEIPIGSLVKAFGTTAFVPFEDGTVLARLASSSMRLADGSLMLDSSVVNVQATADVEIVFGLDSAAKLKPAVPTVQACIGAVEDALNTLAPFFPPR